MVPKFHPLISCLVAYADKELVTVSHSTVETSKEFGAVICVAFNRHPHRMLPVGDHVAAGADDDDPRPGGQHSLHGRNQPNERQKRETGWGGVVKSAFNPAPRTA